MQVAIGCCGVVLLSLNLQFKEAHAREYKLNSSALKGMSFT